MQSNQSMSEESRRYAAVNKRLEDIGWGLFLIMIGVIFLVPEAVLPQGIWLMGAGVILLGLNAVRYFKGIKMSRFTLTLGLLALAAGLGSFLGVKLPLLALLLILVGASIILRPLFGQKGQPANPT